MATKTQLTPVEIGIVGERHVTAQLQSRGFTFCYSNTQPPGATDIEAYRRDSRGIILKSVLVRVKTALFPYHPASLTDDERKGIVSRAARNGSEAWLAQVEIKSDGTLATQITWTQLE